MLRHVAEVPLTSSDGCANYAAGSFCCSFAAERSLWSNVSGSAKSSFLNRTPQRHHRTQRWFSPAFLGRFYGFAALNRSFTASWITVWCCFGAWSMRFPEKCIWINSIDYNYTDFTLTVPKRQQAYWLYGASCSNSSFMPGLPAPFLISLRKISLLSPSAGSEIDILSVYLFRL